MSVWGQPRRLSDLGMSASPPDSGRMAATRLNDVSGHKRKFAPSCNQLVGNISPESAGSARVV
jgi:hypothetical protein